jgi:hypothetical protein
MACSRHASLLATAVLAASVAFVSVNALADADFTSTIQGLEFRLQGGTGVYGYALEVGVGWESVGIRAYDRGFLLSWDGDGQLVVAAASYPVYALYGVQGAGEVEGGKRLTPKAAWSPYVSVSMDAALSALAEGGVPLNGGGNINNLDGLGGLSATADLRLGVGPSFLDVRQSLLVELQFLAELDSGLSDLSPRAYLGGALRGRYDLRANLTAIGEISYAITPSQDDQALGTTTNTGRWVLSSRVLKKFDRFFGGIGVTVSRTETTVAYGGRPGYVTVAPIESEIWILGGFWP